ncbi:uncharacterized protein N7477_009833 [Penicillium maclennaniae]|uniref:uncharacterized protein n=1 Tax=Penicillium maclennaniae TaxID=1343394 RepID=UPI0025406078|nr:uncharacterized protein N7477_009833 [Penicillium maclennaniae]KAJ5662217.1 hypothetical protein N7477_009833 [Penicillium maclennaniae]
MRHLRPRYGFAAELIFQYSKPINFARPFSSSQVNNDLTPFTRRLFKLPTAPPTPTQNHTNLTTFLSYAKRISLPEASTVYVGTHYEYTVLQSLRRYALSLERIGGRDDAGIDLVGTWHLPERERERAVRVLVQCKALKSKLGPNLVRELEGTFRQAPVGWRTNQTAGILISPREATKGVRDALARSSYPLFWMMMERDGTLKQVLWNARAEKLGLGPLSVETRYGMVDSESGAVTKEVALTWNGNDIPHMDQVEQDLLRLENQWVASWGARLSGVEKDVLLDAVQNSFPDGHPDPGPNGVMSELDQTKLLHELRKH